MKMGVAAQIVLEAFGDKMDKSNTERAVRHSLRVHDKVKAYGEDAAVVALLHDVIEDTDFVLCIGSGNGELSPRQATALLAITRLDSETYREYIERVKQDDLATLVKIADIKDNQTRPGNNQLKEFDGMNRKRYIPSLEKLEAEHRRRLLKVR